MATYLNINVLPRDTRLTTRSARVSRMHTDALRIKQVLADAKGQQDLSVLETLASLTNHMLSHKADYTRDRVSIRVFHELCQSFDSRLVSDILEAIESSGILVEPSIDFERDWHVSDLKTLLLRVDASVYNEGISVRPPKLFEQIFDVTLESDAGTVGSTLRFTNASSLETWRLEVNAVRVRLLAALRAALSEAQVNADSGRVLDYGTVDRLRQWDDALRLALELSSYFFISFSWS